MSERAMTYEQMCERLADALNGSTYIELRDGLTADAGLRGLWQTAETLDKIVRAHPAGDIDDPCYNPDAHLEITITAAEARVARAALDRAAERAMFLIEDDDEAQRIASAILELKETP